MNTAIEDNQGTGIHPPLPLTCPLLRIFVLHVKCFKAIYDYNISSFLVNISITASSVEALPGSGTAISVLCGLHPAAAKSCMPS